MRRTIEDVLTEAGLLDETRLRHVRRYARHNGVCLARAAVENGGVSEEVLAATLSSRLRLPRVNLAQEVVDDDAVRQVPYDLAESRRLLPLAIDRSVSPRVIRVAMADPLDFDATEEIEMATGCTVEPLVGGVGEIGDAVTRHYRGVITKMIPRRPVFGAAIPAGTPVAIPLEPTTQPHHQVADEASPELAIRALIEVLVERGVIEREAWLEVIRRLVKEKAGE
ncbi:MAG: ral secretory system protein domain protein [Myxococcales bacterium]|nr:ral secretory system protein domain protein [Myxococcales bacterium]